MEEDKMTRTKVNIGVHILAIVVLAIGLMGSVRYGASRFVGKESYIEVNGPQIAYVPMTTKYVRYDGKLRKVLKFEPIANAATADCRCPKCCNGSCYVIIYTDMIVISGPVRLLYLLWVDC
jgi:hypothetical protein